MSEKETFFQPQTVNDFFLGITRLPHPSKNQRGVTGDENPVRKYVNTIAQEIKNVQVLYDAEATEPGKRVIVLRRPGSPSFDKVPPLILQAHMDMVYNPTEMEFPLQVNYTDSSHTWIKAKEATGIDSTLGADDGIGVATALALLLDPDLVNYPLECLFTVQEETDMGGAQNCDLSNLTGTRVLNLDAETLNVIIYGSAGGSETQFEGNIALTNCPTGYTFRRLRIDGLKGGHSGVDISKGRMNAIKAMAQALSRLNKRITALDVSGDGIGSYDFLIYSMNLDYVKANAIPAEIEVILALPESDAVDFETSFNAYCEALGNQYLPEENGFSSNVYPADAVEKLLDEKSTDALLCILQQIPHGVIRMIPEVPDVVETSSNLYNISIKDTSITINSSNRSSNDTSLQALNEIQKNIGVYFTFPVTTGINSYVSWPPDKESEMLQIAKGVYAQMYGDSGYTATVIHAGLECGELVYRFKNEKEIYLDAISIGPTILDPHTPNERLEVQSPDEQDTVQQFYDSVKKIIVKIFS